MVDHREAPLRAVDRLPADPPGVDGVGLAIDRSPAGIDVASVGHSVRRRAVVEEVHDAGDGVDPQGGGDVLPPVVEDVLAGSERSAVRAYVGADRADRSALVDDESALCVVERVLAPAAIAGGEEVLVAIEDVNARRPRSDDVEAVVRPAIGEVTCVEVRPDRRILGVRTILEPVRALVVAREEVEVVIDVGPTRALVEVPRLPVQIGESVGRIADGVVEADLLTASGDHPGGFEPGAA